MNPYSLFLTNLLSGFVIGGFILSLETESLLAQGPEDEEGTSDSEVSETVVSDTPAQVDVSIVLDQESLNKLPSSMHQLLIDLSNALTDGIKRVQTSDFSSPPDEVFDPESQKATIVFDRPTPDISVAEELAAASKNNGDRLTASQWESIGLTGTFVVPSALTKSKNHVWRLSFFLQEGLESINLRIHRAHKGAVTSLAVDMPRRLFSKRNFSVYDGLKDFIGGLRGILSSVVGLVEQEPKYFDSEIESMIDAALKRHMEAEAVSASEETSGNETLVNSFQAIQYENSDIEKKLKKVIGKFDTSVNADWVEFARGLNIPSHLLDSAVLGESQVLPLIRSVDSSGKAKYNIPNQAVADWVQREKQEFIYRSLESTDIFANVDSKLAKMGPAIAAQGRFLEIQLAEEKSFLEQLGAEYERILKNEIAEHSVLRLSEVAMKQRAYRKWFAYCEENLPKFYLSLEEKAKAANFSGELARLMARRTFLEQVAPSLEASYRGEAPKAVERILLKRQIWFSKNWEIKQDLKGFYYANKVKTTEVTSQDSLFNNPLISLWRVKLFGKYVGHNFLNGNYRLYDWLINGPIGVRSFFEPTEFHPEKKVDALTGEIVDDIATYSSLASDLKTIWRKVASKREEFNARPDNGLLPKKVARVIHFLGNEIISGVGFSVATCTARCLLTLGNVAVSGALMATSPVWATAAATFDSGMQTITSGAKPLFRTIRGALVAPLALFTGTVLNTLAIPLMYEVGSAGVFGYGRMLYDFVMREIVLRQMIDKGFRAMMGRGIQAPGEESKILVRRISGYGISTFYVNRLQQSLALSYLLASFEQESIKMWLEREQEKSETPLNTLSERLTNMGSLFGFSKSSQLLALSELKNLNSKNVKYLNQLVESRVTFLDSLQKRIRGRIFVLPADDLALILKQGSGLAQAFWEKKVFPFATSVQIENFWKKHGCGVADWECFTKVSLKKIFGDKITIPWEARDNEMVVDQETPGASEFLAGILSGAGLSHIISDSPQIHEPTQADDQATRVVVRQPHSPSYIYSTVADPSRVSSQIEGVVRSAPVIDYDMMCQEVMGSAANKAAQQK